MKGLIAKKGGRNFVGIHMRLFSLRSGAKCCIPCTDAWQAVVKLHSEEKRKRHIFKKCAGFRPANGFQAMVWRISFPLIMKITISAMLVA